MYSVDGLQQVYRRVGERYYDNCVLERDRFGGDELIVWAGILCGHKTSLIFVDGNLTAQR